jgi:hypothetical protein
LCTNDVLDTIKQRLEQEEENDKSTRKNTIQRDSENIVVRKPSRDKINKLREDYKAKVSESTNIVSDIQNSESPTGTENIELQEVVIKDSSKDRINKLREEYNEKKEIKLASEDNSKKGKQNRGLTIEEIDN